MKIIAEFEDEEYYDYVCSLYIITCHSDTWHWGINDQGHLCCMCSTFLSLCRWTNFGAYNNFLLPIKTVQKIAKEFERYLKLKAFW